MSVGTINNNDGVGGVLFQTNSAFKNQFLIHVFDIILTKEIFI